MPIAFVGAGTPTLNSTSGTVTAVAMPSATVAGQLLFVMIASVGSSPVPTAPSGWTLVSSYQPGTTLTTYLYRKVAVTGDGSATYTWTWSSSGRTVGAAVAYSGVDTAAGTNTAQVWTHDVANAPIAAASLGAATGDWLVTVAVGRENPGTATTKDWTIDAGGDAERLDAATGGASTDIKVSLAWFDSAGPVTSGSTARSVAVTPVLQQSHVWSILLTLPESETAGGNPWTYLGLPLR